MGRFLHAFSSFAPLPPLWRRRLLAFVLGLGMAGPGAAYPCSLDELLSLPLPRLLELEISPRGISQSNAGLGVDTEWALRTRERP